MQWSKRVARCVVGIVAMFLAGFDFSVALWAADETPPLAPAFFAAAVVSCGQVRLSWNGAQDEAGGSGLRAYVITRNDPDADLSSRVSELSISADRTDYFDTNNVRSSAALTYSVAAEDNAGNRSAPTRPRSIVTPACPGSGSQRVVDETVRRPLGRAIASYGSRTALLYMKQDDNLRQETWLYVHDDNTDASSRFLLHHDPGYRQLEADYLLTSATDLWTLSYNAESGGAVIVSQYRLKGYPMPTSVTLVSTEKLGGGRSIAKAMIQLKSGALMAAWNDDLNLNSDGSVDAGFAYRSPAGLWTSKHAVVIPSPFAVSSPSSRFAMAQHPGDDSVWVFDKRESSREIIALRFTEQFGGLTLNWISPLFVNRFMHGQNSPHRDDPFLTAAPDPSRNAIVLGYQNSSEKTIGGSLRKAGITLVAIGTAGSALFQTLPDEVEPTAAFGLAVSNDGALAVTYAPVNDETVTWNEVYTRRFSGGSWSSPAFVGYAYANYSVFDGGAFGEPAFLVARTDAAEVAFLTPDLFIRTFRPSVSGLPAPDITAPESEIVGPTNGATVTGSATVTARAADNIAVTEVSLLVDGAVVAVRTTVPYTFEWNSVRHSGGSHTLRVMARDAAGNTTYSAPVTVMTSTLPLENRLSSSALSSAMVVKRNTVVNIDVSATDEVGVTQVDIYIDGVLVQTFANAPYVYSWKVPARLRTYVIMAVAYDAAGNSSSATIEITAQR